MTSLRLPTVLGAILLVALGACGDQNPFGPNPVDVEFAPSLGIDLASMTKASSGLYYQDTVVGTGVPASSGDSVSVAFLEWLADGTPVDGRNFTFLRSSLKCNTQGVHSFFS